MRYQCADCGRPSSGERCRDCRTRVDRRTAAAKLAWEDGHLLMLREQGYSLRRIGILLGGITAPAVRMRLQRAAKRQQTREEQGG